VDGTGTAARVSITSGTSGCFDASGNYYFCQADDVVRKVTPAGVVTTLAGSPGQAGSTDGTGSSARFNQPHSVCINPITQELFVSDTLNFVIRKVTLAGVVSTFAGTAGQSGTTDGTGSAARFLTAQNIACDSLQNIFLRDSTTLRRITSSAVVTTLETGLAGSGGVSCDSLNNVYYFSGSFCLKRRSATGASPFVILGDCATLPTSLTDGLGSLGGANNVSLFNPIGPIVHSPSEIYFASRIQSFSTTNAYLRRLVVSPSGNEWAVTTFSSPEPFGFFSGSSSTYNNLIYYSARNSSFSTGTVIRTRSKNIENSNVVVSTFAGSPGQQGSTDGTGSAARFFSPQGIASDSSGNIFVADTYNNTIRKITPAGVVTTLAGSPGQQGLVDGTGSAARFRLPMGITVASSGNIYVADTLNGAVVRKITSAGVVTTLAQNVILSNPAKLCVDSSENVYGSSAGQHSLFKITPDGTVTYLRNNLGISTGNSGIPGAYGIGNVGEDAFFQPTRQMSSPSGIAFGGVDENGRSLFYVTESGNAIVSLFKIKGDSGDTHRLLAGNPPRIIIGPGPTNYTKSGVGSTDGYSGLNLLPIPTPIVALGGGPGGASYVALGGICIASPNLLYFCDTTTHVIRSLQPTNYLGQYAELRTVAGIPGYRGSADGTGVENVSFSAPSDICYVASTNTLYVVDKDNHTIRKIIPPSGSPSSTSVTLSANNTLLTGTASKTFNVNP
jgi:sugar lactone lactonase YvrE